MESSTANDVTVTHPASLSSELDSIETSIHQSLPRTYQDWRLTGWEAEWSAAIDLYARTDLHADTARAKQLIQCRTLAYFYWNRESAKVRVISNACRLRWCPMCSQARYNTIRHAVSNWLKGIRSPKFFTVTMRNCNTPLHEQIDRLYKAFKDLRRHKGLKSRIRGGVWFFQVKRGKNSGQWHPHLHILLDSDYIPKRELSLEWFMATGNSFIIDIRKVEDPEKVSDYVSRYCARPARLSDFSQPDQEALYETLHGKRLCGTFGTGHDCKMRPERTNDADKWIKIGSWRDIISNVIINPARAKVAKAFFTDKTITQEIIDACQIKDPSSGLPPWYRKLPGEPLALHTVIIENKQLTFHQIYERSKDG